MKSIYWFRSDLRLSDNLTLNNAIASSDEILFVYIQDIKNFQDTEWNFVRIGHHRKLFVSQGLHALREKLFNYGHSLNCYTNDSVDTLLILADKFEIDHIYCESIEAHEELDEEIRLRQSKIDLHTSYQYGLFFNCLLYTSDAADE